MNDKRTTTDNVVSIDTNRDEYVEKLLSIADTGPEIPTDGAERVKAALRPVWKKQVRRSTTWMWVGALAASLIIAVVLAQNMKLGPTMLGPVAALETLSGQLQVEEVEGILTMIGESEGGAVFPAGTWLQTDDRSKAALRLESGHSLRVDSQTRLRIAGTNQVFLERGAVYVDSGESSHDSITIQSVHGVTREIGTQFQVRCSDENLAVSVREGLVEVSTETSLIKIPVGRMLRLNQDGSTRTTVISSSDSHWSWILDVAPPYEIEGKTVSAFLDWVGSETGLGIRYADANTVKIATETVLHGSFGELPPDEAPALILPATGLHSELHQGFLYVTAGR